jgi:para-aminobenzoate synthetase component 2
MILVIDNYDSFVHNLARYAGILGHARHVVRHDAVQIPEIRTLNPEGILLSPGPMTPRESGVCLEVLRVLSPTIPTLGVCLGHQCIAEVYGGRVGPACTPTHGRASAIHHSGDGLFEGLPNPFPAGRYHSLSVSVPQDAPLRVTATSEDEEVMALKHVRYPIYGVQFHPESLLTPCGLDLLKNFFACARRWNARKDRAA